MSKRGLYYKLVESQQQIYTPINNETNVNYPVDLPQDDESTPSVGFHSFCQSEVDFHQCSGTRSIQNQSPDKFKENEVHISLWKMLLMNRPEWNYIALGVIGSTIFGLSTVVSTVAYGEAMGLLDQSLQQDVHHLNNVIALVIKISTNLIP